MTSPDFSPNAIGKCVTDRETFENSEDVQRVEGRVDGQVDESVLDDPMGGVEVVVLRFIDL